MPKIPVEIEFEGLPRDVLAITLRGPAKVVVGVLVSGMPQRALLKLSAEIDKWTARQKRAADRRRRAAARKAGR